MAHNANAIAALLMVCSTTISGPEAPSSNSSLVNRKAEILSSIDSNRAELQARELKLVHIQNRIDSAAAAR